MLIPKDQEGYFSLIELLSKKEISSEKWSRIIKIFLSGDLDKMPWQGQHFYLANNDSEEGVAVRENLFLKQGDYELFCLVQSIKNKSSLVTERELNAHLRNCFLIQGDSYSKETKPFWVSNLIKILRDCQSYSLVRDAQPISLGTEKEKVLTICKQELRNYLEVNPQLDRKSYLERFKEEIELFDSKAYWDYLSIFCELIRYIRQEKILTSAGRGSACSSLIVFLLGITLVDPLKYGLLLQRFLNESSERVPDLDIDVESSRKREVLTHLAQTLGPSSFVIPSILKRIKDPKLIASILDKVLTEEEKDNFELLGKLRDIPYLLQPHVSSLVPLKKQANSQTGESYGQGNLSFSLFNDPSQIFPVAHTEYNLTSYLGLQKFDVLSSPYLDFISEVLKEIRSSKGQDIELSEINLNNEKTFQLIGNKLTYYLFHLDNELIKKVLKDFKPTNMEELAQLISIIRPGINKHTFSFIRSKPTEFEVINQLTKETRYIVLYQEQIMKLISLVTQLPVSKTDRYRIALQKKQTEKLEVLKREFFELALKTKAYTYRDLTEIWSFILSFGEYSFNKSHAIAYAISAYQAAFLKSSYPEEFFEVLMRREGVSEKAFQELSLLGFDFYLPSFPETISPRGFFSRESRRYVGGLNLLKKVSPNLSEKLSALEIDTEKDWNLKETIFLLLNKGFSREELFSLNYLNWFRKTREEAQLYLFLNWEALKEEFVFRSCASQSEREEITDEDRSRFREEQKKALSLDLRRFNWID
ncbi:DNA polymerase III DnaE [Candidatus Mycoplasma haematolamae str. Purdue]|uniref:DNA polymerase III DnaE n=1 Tax=Mycoplasma haematolamae (strain Purdue) TaxID=1212765 RepID=I7B8Z5_MYCHA|nr:hypothetical protein [Candidatus Mycoplasma haematolamae]AFO51720.1 DNA polymerase III DnaE [Candidatus Mycoplasma haematolamae str. Purdue]